MKNYSKYINPYMKDILQNRIVHCPEQEQMIYNNVIPVLERKDVYIDEKRIEDGLSLQKYFDYNLIKWEIFLFSLIVGVRFKEDDSVFFTDIRIIIGRGAGKNGFISFLCFYFLSPYHGIKNYDIDILANSEDQAKRSFTDVHEVITDNHDKKENEKALRSNYYATKEIIQGKITKSELKFNTSSKRGKDSKRSGCIIFDEKHEYTDSTNINTLRSGLGKTADGRIITITTDGHIRGGVLDNEKEQNKIILEKYNPNNQTLVFWCRIEKEEEWSDINKLAKANPSLNDFPALKRTIQKEIDDMPFNPEYYPEFLAKRCNYPVGNKDLEVAKWDDILLTNQEMIDLKGMECVGGVDYAKTNDFVVVGLLFKVEQKYYWLQHTFICKKSRDLNGIVAPIDEWVKKGDAEYVEDVEVSARHVTDWFQKQMKKYKIKKIAIDNYRYSYMNKALRDIGFEAYERKNVKLCRPSDIQRVFPIVNSMFINHMIVYGDVPIMRWYTNNTKKVIKGLNYEYGKIEPNYRKTDGFMAFVSAVTIEEEIKERKPLVFLQPVTV